MQFMDTRNGLRDIFIIGAKSIGQYGGYETFVDKLTEYHQNEPSIKYHVACKANGDGFMDESKLINVTNIRQNGKYREFTYHNAHIFKVPVPNIGSAVAVYYDLAALKFSIDYCFDNDIREPVFYILTSRIGPFIGWIKRRITALGGVLYLNPDGHEWKRDKWSAPVRRYWKLSEKLMVKHSDLIICDSINIEKYIREEYSYFNPKTVYLSYGAEVIEPSQSGDYPEFSKWMNRFGLKPGEYYLAVGRFVPENNYEAMLREFMMCRSSRKFVVVSNSNEKFYKELECRLHFQNDKRIVFAGTVYDQNLLRLIRENAYAYVHGHSVGGTNPSLLEALSSTRINLLYDVGFNKEVGRDAAFYWKSYKGDLSHLIDRVDQLQDKEIEVLAEKARDRINEAYNWSYIANQYLKLFQR